MRIAAAVLIAAACSPAFADDAKVIDTPTLRGRMAGPPERWDLTLVDARTQVEFSEAHIPGAVLIPANAVGAQLPKTVADKGRTVVFYCNGPNCTKTVKAAKAALAAGYRDVLEYKDGLPGWGKAGFKIDGIPLPRVQASAVTPAALRAALGGPGAPIAIDIRDAEEYAKFHIAEATSIPIDELGKQLKSVPAARGIVIVDHAGHQAPVAVRLLASLGRNDVKRLDGGVLRWQAEGMPLWKAP
jgi:rhodanese-related sulfurtransferase